MQVSVRHGDMLLRDTVIWDIAQPYNAAEAYAGAICEGLGLRFDWFHAIASQVQQLVADVREVQLSIQTTAAVLRTRAVGSICQSMDAACHHKRRLCLEHCIRSGAWLIWAAVRHAGPPDAPCIASTTARVRRRSGARARRPCHSCRLTHLALRRCPAPLPQSLSSGPQDRCQRPSCLSHWLGQRRGSRRRLRRRRRSKSWLPPERAKRMQPSRLRRLFAGKWVPRWRCTREL